MGRKEGGGAKIRARSRLGASIIGFPPSSNLSSSNGRRELCYQHVPAVLYRAPGTTTSLILRSICITRKYQFITHKTTLLNIRMYLIECISLIEN